MLFNNAIETKKFSPFRILVYYSILLFLTKLALLPFVHVVDSDAVSRVYLSIQLAEHFSVIKTGNWPPLFFYLMGVALKIYNSTLYTPILVNIILSTLTLFPIYSLMKRLFNDTPALMLCIFYSLSPIIFRLSLEAMSETPFVFFVALSGNMLAKGIIEKRNNYILFSGLLLSIAGGFRYESWILTPFITLIILHQYSFKKALLFLIPASIFPIYWLSSNFLSSDSMFSSFTWAMEAPKINKIDSLESLLRRTWWYPLSLIFAFGPIAFYFFMKEILIIFRNKKANLVPFLFFILFLVFFLIYAINCYRGSLLLQHRFTFILFLLSFPFLGFYFQRNSTTWVQMLAVFSLSAFFLAFTYSSKGARPIPRLQNKNTIQISKTINQNISSNSGLILDFTGWEATYFESFMSGLPQQNIAIFNQDNPAKLVMEQIKTILQKHPAGCIVYSDSGRLKTEISINGDTMIFNNINQKVNVTILSNYKGIIVYKYKL